MAAHVERDADICRRYVEGQTLQEIGTALALSRQRILQILREHHVDKRERTPARSDRDEFLGVNISEAAKTALRAEAARRGLSMSALTADLIKDMLAERNAS